MLRRIKTSDDLVWLLNHSHSFHGGQINELHVRKQRMFDESSGREVVAGTNLTAVIRYEVAVRGPEGLYAVTRVARLIMRGVTDFSIFEQEGADCSEIHTIHAEVAGGRLRFWFDPRGEFYAVCDQAELDEVSRPGRASCRPSSGCSRIWIAPACHARGGRSSARRARTRRCAGRVTWPRPRRMNPPPAPVCIFRPTDGWTTAISASRSARSIPTKTARAVCWSSSPTSLPATSPAPACPATTSWNATNGWATPASGATPASKNSIPKQAVQKVIAARPQGAWRLRRTFSSTSQGDRRLRTKRRGFFNSL